MTMRQSHVRLSRLIALLPITSAKLRGHLPPQMLNTQSRSSMIVDKPTPTQSAYTKHIKHLPWFTKALCWYMLVIELIGVLTIILLCFGYRFV